MNNRKINSENGIEGFLAKKAISKQEEVSSTKRNPGISKFFLIGILALLISINLNAQPWEKWEVFDLYNANVPDPSGMPRYFTEYNGNMYFSAYDNVNGYELWVTDSSQSGTKLLKDIRPGTGSSNPEYLIVYNNKLFFVASDGVSGEELWSTDGTEAGTVLVKDINSGSPDSYMQDFNLFNGKLFFGATDGVNGYELWSTDGTSNGTVMFKDIKPGSLGSYSGLESAVIGNKLVFLANAGTTGYEPWVTDGTPEGTFLLMDIYIGSTTSDAYLFQSVGDTAVYFTAKSSAGGKEVYITDGTVIGTRLLKDIVPGTTGSFPKNYTSFKGKVFFRADDGINGTELWVTDGTTAGTQLFMDINPGSDDSGNGYTDPTEENFYVYNGLMYFSAVLNPYGDEVWVSDGTVEGTKMVKEIWAGTFGCSAIYFTGYHDYVYFRAFESSGLGEELYRTNGTPEGTGRVINEQATGWYALNSSTELFVFKDALWLRGKYTLAHGNELWKYSNGINTTGVSNPDIKNRDLLVYPNPATTFLNVEIKDQTKKSSFEVLDNSGRKVLHGKIEAANTHINLGSLASGFYFFRVNGQVAKFQVVK